MLTGCLLTSCDQDAYPSELFSDTQVGGGKELDPVFDLRPEGAYEGAFVTFEPSAQGGLQVPQAQVTMPAIQSEPLLAPANNLSLVEFYTNLHAFSAIKPGVHMSCRNKNWPDPTECR